MDRIALAEEILSALGGGDGLRSLGGRRLQAVDEGIVFEVERGIDLYAFVLVSKADGFFSIYVRTTQPPYSNHHRQGLNADGLMPMLQSLLCVTA